MYGTTFHVLLLLPLCLAQLGGGPTLHTLTEPQSTQFSPQSSTQQRPPDIYTQGSDLSVGNTAREGHLSPGALVQLPISVVLRRYTSISVRTCSPGPLLRQEGAQGDGLLLEVTEDGAPRLALTRLGASHTVTVPGSIVDNAWHHIFLKFELGVLSLGVDSTLTPVANTTGPLAPFLDLDLWSSQPVLTVGGGAFSGCVLEGAGVPLSHQLTRHTGVQWGICSLPDDRNCSGYDTDPCFSAPCGSHGACIASAEGTRCRCYARYAGPTCRIDLGPLCSQPGNACSNGGICQEDWRGNSTTCACATGYTGARCEAPVSSACNFNPCLHGGVCEISQFGDVITCACPEGTWGQYCELQADDCADAPCRHGGNCTDLLNAFSCACAGTGYQGTTCSSNIDECSEQQPCAGGATCYDLYGGYDCVCLPGTRGPRCEEVLEECSSDPCQHGGSCQPLEGSSGFVCQCLSGFEGQSCDHNIDDCLDATCPQNSHCVDGVNEYTCRCDAGHAGAPPNCTQIDECESGPCHNGATCFDESNAFTCICAPGFTGLACEENIDECAGAPCQNGGQCVDGVGGHQCSCTPGFTGGNCETNIDECTMRVCSNAASCNDTYGGYECECLPGWLGTNCDEDINECSSSPCTNGAVCSDRINSFHCACQAGYTGEFCEIDRNECAGVTCLNGGTCQDGLNNYTCDCLPAYTGLHCADRYDACSSQPCQNMGNCITRDNDNQPDFYCECLLGFEGLLCSNNVNDCLGATCPEGLVCQDLVNNYECRCPEGYTGPTCEEDIDECQSTPCLNEGECYDAVANYTCACSAGFTGHNCEEDVNECLVSGLCNNGICDNTLGSYQCYCRPGFSGDHCHLEFDECLSHPCRNNGTCINEINGYQCICQPGFTGVDCDVEIDECEVVPCRNGATCIDMIADFSCVCVPGYTDMLCETNIDECEPVPCMNAGQCLDGINNYTCNCSDTGFKGGHCEVNIDDCEPEPCQHGSNCTDLIKDYSCNCYEGYEGKDCETDTPECAAVPCQAGGTCLERSNATLYEMDVFQDFSYATAGGYACQCIPGFAGTDCEINIDECESSPCIHGECIDGINSYSCECEAGYEGSDCELEIDECELHSPCQHGACEDQIADYNCACHSDYGGKNCSVALVGCLDVDCLHGGSCEPLLFQETRHDFLCHCQPGFTGRYCAHLTTFSLAGSSYLMVNSQTSDGYSLEFWFRTTLPSGILAVGQGETYFSLEMEDGRLNLHSSLLNQWEGIFAGQDLNTGEWQQVKLFINGTHALLGGGQDTLIHPIAPPENHTTFTTTVLGGATPTLRVLSKGAPFFIGCMQDAVVNGHQLVPSHLPSQKRVAVVDGCPRQEQCAPNPCHNGGECLDLWNSFQCECPRPHLGETCLLSFTAATFGNEAVRDSLVTVGIPATDAALFARHLDVSLLLRTRQADGLVFYVGTHLNNTEGSYVLCSLREGRPQVAVMLAGAVNTFLVDGPGLSDGEPHLLQVLRIEDQIYVFVDDVSRLNATLDISGDLYAEVMYLGGLPPTTLPASLLASPVLSRTRRQLGTRNDNDGSTIHNTLATDAGSLNFNSGSTSLNNEFTASSFGSSNNLNGNNDINFDDRFGSSAANGFAITDQQLPPSSARPDFDFFSERTSSPDQGFESASPQSTVFHSSSFPLPSSFSPSSSPSSFASSSFPSSSPASFPSTTNFLVADVSSSAQPRQIAPSSGPVHFKGVMQDIRISNGSLTRLVQPFLLRAVEGEQFTLPGASLSDTSLHNVLEGTVSDAACMGDPCTNGATCSVTWNDYHCSCTFGFKGKNCDELEYCARHSCPDGSSCRNLMDGYECLADLTMNGVNSSLGYRAVVNNSPAIIDVVSVAYRSQVGGELMRVAHGPMSVVVTTTPDGVTVLQTNPLSVMTSHYVSPLVLDGDWHTLNVTLDAVVGVTVTLDNSTLEPVDDSMNTVIVDLKQLVLNGNILLGGGEDLATGHSPVQDDSHDPAVSQQPSSGPPHPFRGCLGEVRIQEILLPPFRPELLAENTALNKFELISVQAHETGCRVCYDHECHHGGHCEQPDQNYTCSCLSGFEGDVCQVNIDDCVDNVCENGAYCLDGVDEYHCQCAAGYEGERCQTEINECDVGPCRHGGTCTDGIATFTCACMEEYIGETCADLKINNCESQKCQNNATCTDLYTSYQSKMDRVADNYSCDCPFGYSGHNCDVIVDYCDTVDCHNGTCGLPFRDPGWHCDCAAGYEGAVCDEEVDECLSNPCLNGATCEDLFLGYTCLCATGWEDPTNCATDIDECTVDQPCTNGSNCTNMDGSFLCMCREGNCGQTCRLSDPCMEVECSNDGDCVAHCDETRPYDTNNTQFFCACTAGWGGDMCDEPLAALSTMAMAILIGALVGVMLLCAVVGLVVFLMMAKKKRATRGTYSPSRQEFFSPRVEMDAMMKPPPEERLI